MTKYCFRIYNFVTPAIRFFLQYMIIILLTTNTKQKQKKLTETQTKSKNFNKIDYIMSAIQIQIQQPK